MELLTVARGNRAIVGCVSEKGGWCFRGDLEFIGVESDEFFAGVRTEEVVSRSSVSAGAHCDDRIDENGEVRAAAFLSDRVTCFTCIEVEFCGGHGGEMSSCRKAHDANTITFDVPVRGSHAGHSKGSSDVGKRTVWISFWESVIQDDSDDALRIQPPGNGSPFRSDDLAITPARANHDGGSVWFLRAKDGEGGIGILKFPGSNRSLSLGP